jgi:hypothetical protein
MGLIEQGSFSFGKKKKHNNNNNNNNKKKHLNLSIPPNTTVPPVNPQFIALEQVKMFGLGNVRFSHHF